MGARRGGGGGRHHPSPTAIDPNTRPLVTYETKDPDDLNEKYILDCDFNFDCDFDCFNHGLLYSLSRKKFPYSRRFQEQGIINITLQRLGSKILLKRGSIRTAFPLLISLLKGPAGLMLLSRIKLLIYLPRAEGGECSTMQYLGIGGPPRVRNPHPV